MKSADTARSTSRRSTCALAPVRPNQSGMHTCGFCSQRRQDGCWDRVRLYPADYVGTAQRKQAGQPLPLLDPQVVAACKERNPDFGMGGGQPLFSRIAR